uniref:Asp-tRNA(Asn)/Glu-tRNA(Gln) amidotransferase subunit GatC n=1 Tax=Ignisphaera aggregans TaxID=334771 RepID=A0A7C2ZRZ7_9CREN
MDSNIIDYLCNLALVSFTDAEKDRLVREIEKIMDMFSMLNNAENLEQWGPLYHVHDVSLHLRSDDELGDIDPERSLLKDNALIVEGYVKAPKTTTE